MSVRQMIFPKEFDGVENSRGEVAMMIRGSTVACACRMASTRAGTTVVNQRAYEKINDKFSALYSLTAGVLEVKHEAAHV